MSRKALYPVAQSLTFACKALDVSEDDLCRRVGLPVGYTQQEIHGVPASTFLAIWETLYDLTPFEDGPMRMGRTYAVQGSHGVILAFSSSTDVLTGFERIALFKPLAAPVRLRITETGDSVTITLEALETSLRLCSGLAGFDIAFFTELCRHYTGHHVVPLAACMPEAPRNLAEYQSFLGTEITVKPEISVTLRRQDAELPLLTENAELWRGVEPTLRRQLLERSCDASLAERVEWSLMELLPSGKAGADDVCASLGLSRRSLQRRLQGEGHSYRALLDRTREKMAIEYLKRDSMSVPEISYLLAYRDPNSFYRAFQSWTGMTPGEARSRFADPSVTEGLQVVDGVHIA